MRTRATIGTRGRITLPAGLRKRHRLAQGDAVIIEERDGSIAPLTPDQAIQRAQAIARRLVAGRAGTGVDDFLAERRRGSD